MKGHLPHLFIAATVCLLIAAGCAAQPTPTPTPVPPTPTPDPFAIVKAYQDAIARSDVDAAIALFTDDAKYTLADVDFNSKASIRNWLEYVVALNTRTKSSDCKPGPTIVCEWRFTNDCCTTGYDVTHTMGFTVEGDKIVRVLAGQNDSPEYYQWSQAFLPWASANYPTEMAAFGDAWNTENLNREIGETIVKVCKAYAESQK